MPADWQASDDPCPVWAAVSEPEDRRTGTDDKGRGRVTGIDLDVTVFMDQEYEFIFDRVEKIMKQGCLITGSLEAAFPVKYNLNLECDED